MSPVFLSSASGRSTRAVRSSRLILILFCVPEFAKIAEYAANVLKGESLSQDEEEDEDEEELEEESELVSSAADLVGALATVLGSDFSAEFGKLLPLLRGYYVSLESSFHFFPRLPSATHRSSYFFSSRARIEPRRIARPLLVSSERSSQDSREALLLTSK